MVEGPGCKINGEKLHSKVVGQTVKEVKGTVIDEITQIKKSSIILSHYAQLIGKTLTDVKTLGKELFAIFDDICLRVHFLMNGFIRFNEEPSGIPSDKSPASRLILQMSQDTVALYECSVGIRSLQDCMLRYENLQTLDICFSGFNAKRAFLEIRQHNSRLICDVLLDQTVLPGVGNIIKNEALFDSGINPNLRVEELDDSCINFLIKMTRDFTLLFYKCHKKGKSIQSQMKIYLKRQCTQCKEKIIICKLGEYYRKTFYCPSCQPFNPNMIKKSLPRRNSLLGWLGEKSSSWVCPMCTLINSTSRKQCEACDYQNSISASVNQENISAFSNKRIRLNDVPSSSRSHEETKTKKIEFLPQRLEMNEPKDILFHKKINSSTGFTAKRSSSTVDNVNDITLPSPKCLNHSRICTLKRVIKNDDNIGRLFYSCSLPQGKQCNFFKWADLNFPLCSGHKKRCVKRTVVKLGLNNGRNFYACGLSKNLQCGYFMWANDHQQLP